MNDYIHKSSETNTFCLEHISDIYNRVKELLTEILQDFVDKLQKYFAAEQLETKQLQTVSTYCKTDIERNCDLMGPYWSYGVHHEKETFLIGFLCVEDGLLTLKDTFLKVSVILNGNKSDLLKYINKFVLIKGFIYFTEHFKEASTNVLDYVATNLQEIKVLNFQLQISYPQILHLKNVCGDFKFVLRFVVVKKFQININDDGAKEFCLEIDSKKYAIFDSYYLSIYPLIEIGGIYLLKCNKPLETCLNKELSRINGAFKMILIKGNDSVLVQIKKGIEEEHPSVASVLQSLANAEEPLCFEGVLNVKKFVKPLSSRTEVIVKVPGFGTSASHTHVLEFFNSTQKLVVYLNNWERMQNPLGLIPEAKIRVRWAMPQKGKYLKSTCMTTFEFLSYENPIKFSTCPLLSSESWGKRTYIGLGMFIPNLVLVWGTVFKVFLRSLKFSHICTFCNKPMLGAGCTICQNIVPTLKIMMTCFVIDEMGQSLVISSSENLLRLLLNLEKHEWEVWLKAVQIIGYYEYNKEDVDKCPYNDKECFQVALATNFAAINESIYYISLKCRKMDCNNSDSNEGCPLWYCVDARKRRI